MIKGIKYIAPMLDNSGYAKAARGYIIALHKQGVPLTLSPISFEQSHPDLGESSKIINFLINKDIDYDTVIIHTTPEFWSKYREEGKTNIGYTVWETDALHPDWPVYINSTVSKVLVPCDWNRAVFVNSGVTVPVEVVPHVVETFDFSKNEDCSDVLNVEDKNTFLFYNINQWTERKNPLATIKAYWTAFQNDENVGLVLKTYGSNYSSPERDAIRSTIKRLKQMIVLPKYPPIYLILDMLSEEEIVALHKRCDCYIALDRGEGWGLSTATAGAAGNVVISTNFGGVLQYLSEDNSYLIDYVLTPVSGMPYSPWYLGTMNWAEVSISHGAFLANEIYNDVATAKIRSNKLQQDIKDYFSEAVIGKLFLNSIS
jgi:glycosyltransferase involved in cell wall biosynthesis